MGDMHTADREDTVPGQRSISLAAARLMALEVLSETERRLREERAAEARFLLEPWGEEI